MTSNNKLNEKVIKEAFQMASNWDDKMEFNCWGFAAAHAGWISKFTWLTCAKMNHLLADNAEPVQEPDVGDIVAYYDREGYLIHTSVYAGGGLYYHKEGSCGFHNEDRGMIYIRYPEIAKEVVMRPKREVA